MLLLGAVNAFCTVNCDGGKATAPTRKQQSNPEWNWGALFYRKKPQTKPITFEVVYFVFLLLCSFKLLSKIC